MQNTSCISGGEVITESPKFHEFPVSNVSDLVGSSSLNSSFESTDRGCPIVHVCAHKLMKS